MERDDANLAVRNAPRSDRGGCRLVACVIEQGTAWSKKAGISVGVVDGRTPLYEFDAYPIAQMRNRPL